MSAELLAHRLHGQGSETVLLLNGGMMTYGSWDPISRHLANGYRLLGCDFRGQLKSPGDAHLRIEDNVADVVTLLDALDLETVHVLGTSFGGEVGLVLASLQPSRVRSLVLVTAADRTPPGMKEDSRVLQDLACAAAASGDHRPFYDHMVRGVYSDDYRRLHSEEFAARRDIALPASWYRGLHGILASIEDFDFTEHLGRVACPTLVVHAALDTVMPEERVRALADGIAGARLRVHPTSGHVLVVEDPEWLAAEVREFLSGLPAAPDGPDGPAAVPTDSIAR